MATIEREFYRSARGPAPMDEDTWLRRQRLLVAVPTESRSYRQEAAH